MVECHLAKVDVEGSSPFSRSQIYPKYRPARDGSLYRPSCGGTSSGWVQRKPLQRCRAPSDGLLSTLPVPAHSNLYLRPSAFRMAGFWQAASQLFRLMQVGDPSTVQVQGDVPLAQAKTHFPAVQVSGSAHSCPQAPQCPGFRARVTHEPPHHA